VTFVNGECEVEFAGGARRQSMPCEEVVSFLTATLKLPRGALFDVVTIPDVSEAEYDAVMAGLKAAGYKRVPGIHVGFLTEPKGK